MANDMTDDSQFVFNPGVRKSLADLAVELGVAAQQYQGRRVLHVKSAEFYRITGVVFREADMALVILYSPTGSEYFGSVIFSRTVEEMDFGRRFILEDAPGEDSMVAHGQ